MSVRVKEPKTFDKKKIRKRLIGSIQRMDPFQDLEVDADGRLVFFTDLFLWDDFTIRDQPQNVTADLTEEEEDDGQDIVEEEFTFSDN